MLEVMIEWDMAIGINRSDLGAKKTLIAVKSSSGKRWGFHTHKSGPKFVYQSVGPRVFGRAQF